MTRVRRPVLLLVLLLLLAGCGLGGASETTEPVRVLVSRDFGGQQVGRMATGAARGETVLGLLERSFDVQTRGRAVQGVGDLRDDLDADERGEDEDRELGEEVHYVVFPSRATQAPASTSSSKSSWSAPSSPVISSSSDITLRA
jgi:hypothetical protein